MQYAKHEDRDSSLCLATNVDVQSTTSAGSYQGYSPP